MPSGVGTAAGVAGGGGGVAVTAAADVAPRSAVGATTAPAAGVAVGLSPGVATGSGGVGPSPGVVGGSGVVGLSPGVAAGSGGVGPSPGVVVGSGGLAVCVSPQAARARPAAMLASRRRRVSPRVSSTSVSLPVRPPNRWLLVLNAPAPPQVGTAARSRVTASDTKRFPELLTWERAPLRFDPPPRSVGGNRLSAAIAHLPRLASPAAAGAALPDGAAL